MAALNVRSRPLLCFLVALAAAMVATTPAAQAGVPRFISGQDWGIPAGWSAVWPTTSLQYFTDQGDLGPSVTHAEADQMVQAAASVWNSPLSSISLVQGGNLQEDVSPENTVFDGQRVIFPQDMQIANERAVPVAIVYDATGKLIDLLLGAGGSAPSGCLQNAVIGDIDDLHQNDGSLRHATLLLNGRCVGSTPEQLTQMQYQLARAFGRVLGISWSQVNDNVFTAQTTVTAQQVAYWPLMHPLDVVCGGYTFQCMSNPFTLRPEDLNTLTLMYPIPLSNVPNGKHGSNDDALALWGVLYFPSGPGMDWTNIAVHRLNHGVMEEWQTVSSITGYQYIQSAATPIQPQPPTTTGNPTPGVDGLFFFRRIPCDGVSDLFFTSEAINPLYTGDAAIGPYVHPPVTLSGTPVTYVGNSAFSWGDNQAQAIFSSPDAVASCDDAGNGTEQQPTLPDSSGWQKGHLCSWSTNTWWHTRIAAGHSWTLEVTATDETGAATGNKLQPVVGVWRGTDPTGTLPTVTSQPVPFNSLSTGMTQVRMNTASTTGDLRISLSDQFGAGRPDFSYIARFLYAQGVSSTAIPSEGGPLTITGTGFQQGIRVLLNGVSVPVLNLSSTQITVGAPAMPAVGGRLNQALDLTLTDTLTGGTAGISRAVHYVQSVDQLQVVSAPVSLKTGLPSTQPLVLRLVSADGTTPVAGANLILSVTKGSAQFGTCTGICFMITDALGQVQTPVTGLAAGPVTITVSQSNGPGLVVEALDTDPGRALSFREGGIYLAQGASPALQVEVDLLVEQVPSANVPVTWSATSGVRLQQSETLSGGDGSAVVRFSLASDVPAGSQTITACAWSALCSSWTITVVPPSQWMVAPVTTTSTGAAIGGTAQQLALQITDQAGHPLQGATVYIYQRVLEATPPCVSVGRCPAAAVLDDSQTTRTSDSEGQVDFLPLSVAGVPQTLQVAAATGATSFTSWSTSSGGS